MKIMTRFGVAVGLCVTSILMSCHGQEPKSMDCVADEGPLDENCPNDCELNIECEAGFSCQKAPCGGCHCFTDTGPEPDCCYDDTLACAVDECRFHSNCSSNQLCKAQPGCAGGCVCDSGEELGCMDDPTGDCRSDGCSHDDDCESYERCVNNDCGGCVCAIVREYDCCPDPSMEPTCPKDCSNHADCDGDLICTRNDCGGCQCQTFVKPDWADCFLNPKTVVCADECHVDSECPDDQRGCGQTKYCDGCECCSCPLNDGLCNLPDIVPGEMETTPTTNVNLKLGSFYLPRLGIDLPIMQIFWSGATILFGSEEAYIAIDLTPTTESLSSLKHRETVAPEDLEVASAYACLVDTCSFRATYAVLFEYTLETEGQSGKVIVTTDNLDISVIVIFEDGTSAPTEPYTYVYLNYGDTYDVNKGVDSNVGCPGVFVFPIDFTSA